MTERLDPEIKRLRRLSPGDLADEAFILKTRIDAIKEEAVRRGLKTAEGQAGRITLSRLAHRSAATARSCCRSSALPKANSSPASAARSKPTGA